MPSHVLVVVYDPLHSTELALDIQADLAHMFEAVHASGRVRLELVLDADIERIRKRLTRTKSRFTLLHFSGHSNSSGLVISDEQGGPTQPPPLALSDFLHLNAKYLKVVVLNSCDGLAQAKLIAQWVPYVIAMAGPIHDRSAIEFAGIFYTYYRGPKSSDRAFAQAVNKLHLNGDPDRSFPRLFVNGKDVTALCDERTTPPNSLVDEPSELSLDASGTTPLLRQVSERLAATGSPRGRRIAALLHELDLVDDLMVSRLKPSVYLLRTQNGSLRIPNGKRFAEVTCMPGADVKLSYHAPSDASLHFPIVTLFYDAYSGTLFVRFGGCDIFTLSNIAALQPL